MTAMDLHAVPHMDLHYQLYSQLVERLLLHPKGLGWGGRGEGQGEGTGGL